MIEGARGTLSLKNIVHPLPLPNGTELISLTTFEGRLVILTNKGPYIWRDSQWERVAASNSEPEGDRPVSPFSNAEAAPLALQGL
jgi:hypothetical protein